MKKLLSIITAMVMIFCLMPPPITAEAALSITYREYAADGSYTEKTLQESEYLKYTGLDVLEDNTYFYSTSYTPSEQLTIKGDVNLILPVGSVFEVKQYITIERDATLNIYGAGTLKTGQFNIFDNDGNVNLHGANVISLYDINVSSLTVNAGKVSAMVNGIFCTNLAVNGGTVEAENSNSPAIFVNGTFTVGKNGSVSGYSSNDVAFSKVPTVNNSDDIIVSYGDSKSSYSLSTTKPIDDDLISRHYVSIEKGKKSVDYIKREYADDTGVTDTPTSAPAVRSISSFSQPSALSGWYYVDGNVDLNYRPVISQNACIILTDGSKLNANCGIELPEGCTLEIYGQENGTGTIKSSLTDIDGDAFIGGDLGKKCGTLKLFGGNIKIDYNSYYHNDLIGNGAGIAIGDGAVYVYGGSIDAKAVQAIITTKLNIYGGSVTAFSYNDKAMYSVPAFGTGYIPTVKYGGSAESAKNATSPTDSSVYTSNKYVSIEKANITADYEYYEYAWNGSESVGSLKTAACTTLDDSYFPTALSDGWYAVKGDVTVSDRITINGDVHLILTDGCKLDATQGINLPEGNTLNIYGQGGGTGKLNAIYAFDGTAIGGNYEENCGVLNVYGGDVSATSDSGAAIGGGYSIDGTAGNGGIVKVYGGEVSAASDSGAAIGGGCSTDGTGGDGGIVEIYGGEVIAESYGVAAIGGGVNANGVSGGSGQTVISGGSVRAYSGKAAFDHVPTFGAGYIPKVTYGEYGTSTTSAVNPADSVYTSNKYISIKNAPNAYANVDYITNTWDGQKVVQSIETAKCLMLGDDYKPSELTGGWYALGEDVTITDRIKISGDVHLILTDGCNLTAKKGINLPESSTLSIYGQSGGTGKLNAESGNKTAIGGENEENCGTLNVYGGQVSAESSGTAIGGGKSAIKTAGNGGTVNVYGGQVSAESQGTAIGGGSSTDGTGGNGGTVNVYGGTVNAISDSETAIGGGFSTSGTGGTGSDLTVYGGKVSAKSSSFTAIGGGRTTSGTAGNPGTTHICGGSLIAYVIMDNNLPAFDHAPTYDAGYVPKVTFGDSPTNSATKISPDPTVYTGNRYVSIEQGTLSSGNYKYCSRSWNGSSVVSSIETQNCTTLNNEYFPKTLNSGWYAVEGNVTVLNQIEISGKVNLILTDDCALNVADSIHLTSGNTLNIYGQSKETGKLHIIPKSYTAIGAYDKDCGNLNIHGGIITAERSANGAAVGGSKAVIKLFGGDLNAISGNSEVIGGEGSEIYVYGGKIYADSFANTPSMSIPAIGVGASGKIVICGGSVTAYAFVNGAYAFDYAPTFDAGYIPKVSYGESESSTVTKVNPDNSVYTSNKYVSIEKADLTADYQYCSRSWNGSSVVTSIESHDCITLDNTYFPTTLTDGWYAVKGDVTVSDRITINGDVQLILTDGCTLNAKMGINLPENSTLSIYGQSGGTGKLNAEYDRDTAIGGEYGKSCGTLNVYGGTVNANSTNEAAIGGGDSIDGTSGNGGTVNVYGGTVNAVSDSGTAIGGGDSATGTGGNGGTVNVYGGKLTADSSRSVAIGGGSSATGPAGNGGTVNVYGGTVDANSAYDAAIGGGCSVRGTAGNGGTVNVYGGKLNAVSSSRAAIGGGLGANRTPGNPGQTFISGGSVSAYSKYEIAFDHAPTYGTNYVPKVTYGESDTSTVTKINPDNSVYTSNKYVLIEKSNINDDHEQCGHSANTNPTCEGANCSVCGTYIAPTGHKNGDPVTENRTFASCTEGGSYDEVVYCSVCNAEISRETKAIEPSEHTAGKPVIENEAADGSYDEVVYCAVCNAEMSRERKVKAEHKHIEGMADVITMPTFTSAGSRVFRCTLCGEILRSEAIPPITVNFPTNTVSSGNASQVIYTEFPELKFNVEIKDGIAVISWDKVETADRYVIYAIKDGKISEIAKIRKTSFETTHQNGTNYFVRYMKNGVLSPKAKSMNEDITSDKPIVSASAGKDFIRLDWQDMGAEKYNIYKYADGKAIKIGEVKKTAVKIINLSPDTEYKFIVTTVIDGKETTMLTSDILTVRTKKA